MAWLMVRDRKLLICLCRRLIVDHFSLQRINSEYFKLERASCRCYTEAHSVRRRSENSIFERSIDEFAYFISHLTFSRRYLLSPRRSLELYFVFVSFHIEVESRHICQFAQKWGEREVHGWMGWIGSRDFNLALTTAVFHHVAREHDDGDVVRLLMGMMRLRDGVTVSGGSALPTLQLGSLVLLYEYMLYVVAAST